jgi:hypothetical protein
MENLAKVSKERDAARAERAAREAEARALETRLEQESKRLEGLRAEVADMTDKYTARLAELQAEHRAAVAGSEQLVKDKDALAERRAPSRTRPASGRCGGGAERWRRRAGTGWRRRLRRRRAHGRSERACRGSWQSYARASPRRAPRRLPSAPARAPARCPPQRGGGAVCQLSGQQRIGSANTGGGWLRKQEQKRAEEAHAQRLQAEAALLARAEAAACAKGADAATRQRTVGAPSLAPRSARRGGRGALSGRGGGPAGARASRVVPSGQRKRGGVALGRRCPRNPAQVPPAWQPRHPLRVQPGMPSLAPRAVPASAPAAFPRRAMPAGAEPEPVLVAAPCRETSESPKMDR